MGAAAYNRGSRAISAQIDMEQAQKPKHVEEAAFVAWWSDRAHAKQEARIASLESDLSGARDLIERLNAERNALRHEIDAERRHSRLLTDMFLGQHKRLEEAGNQIAWLKGLLRFCGVGSEQVRRYEECR